MRVDGNATLLLGMSFMVTNGSATTGATAEDQSSSVCHTISGPLENCLVGFPLRARHVLTPLFPNVTRLACAWEVHPLVSKVAISNPNRSQPIHRIPTMFHNGISTTSHPSTKEQGEKNDTNILSWTSLLSINDIPSILSQTNDGNPLLHGSDYKLVKKILLPPLHEHAGEEYMGMLPKPYYSMQEVLHHFHYGGFSLVIDRMQIRSMSVAKKTRQLEEALGVKHVGVNLYLTPEALEEEEDGRGGWTREQVRQGFEAHWDWMDVIVVQMSGRKRWTVAKEPTIYLSNRDQKRKPSKEEAAYFASDDGHFFDFTLCPGDVLYIPRGFLHNASTIDFEEFEGTNGYDDAWDGCPMYAVDSAGSQSLASRVHGPSLHLTFGIEQGCEGTMEALLHHALHAYFADTPSFHSTVAIPSCDATWKSILHFSLGEVARRQHECDYTAYNRVDSKDECNGNAILRQSVWLLPHVGNNLSLDEMQQLSNLKKMYRKSIDAFLLLADMTQALEFVKIHVMQPFDANLPFCFPGYTTKDAITCVDELLSATKATSGRFGEVVQGFVAYASANFDAAMKHMHQNVNKFVEKHGQVRGQ